MPPCKHVACVALALEAGEYCPVHQTADWTYANIANTYQRCQICGERFAHRTKIARTLDGLSHLACAKRAQSQQGAS